MAIDPMAAKAIAKAAASVATNKETRSKLLYIILIIFSLKKTAEKMFVEESTVKTHLKSIYQKVGCANKTELLVLAMQAKLVLPKKQEN